MMTRSTVVIITVSVLAVGGALLILGYAPPRTSQNQQETTSLTKARPGDSRLALAKIHSPGPGAASHPTPQALTLPETVPEGDDQQLGILADRWARRDPSGAAVWVAELPEGPEKTRVISAMAAAWADANPQAAADLVTALELPDGEAKTQAAVSVVSAWAMTDPSAAARWVETFPVGHIREYAMENVAFQWMQSDPAAFMAWVQRLPETADRDSAINAGVGTLVESDPDMAVRLSEAIGNEGTRRYQMERAVRRWLETDRVAARIWISGSSLADEAKQRLLAQVLPEAGH